MIKQLLIAVLFIKFKFLDFIRIKGAVFGYFGERGIFTVYI